MPYPSLYILPIPAAIFTIIHYSQGPLDCIIKADKTAKFALKLTQKFGLKRKLDPQKMQKTLPRVQRIIRRIPRAACLETACALQIWLALGGQKSQVKLGKRYDNNTILMHAWLDAQTTTFFYDPRFQNIKIKD